MVKVFNYRDFSKYMQNEKKTKIHENFLEKGDYTKLWIIKK